MSNVKNAKQTASVRALVESGIMLALGFLLSYVQLIKMPFGGTVTPASMLPVMLIALKYGARQGLVVGFAFSLLQTLQGGAWAWGLSPAILVFCFLLDYIIPFSLLGLAGLPAFRGKGATGEILGIIFAMFLRFVCHYISGVTIWGYFMSGFTGELIPGAALSPLVYSLAYNGMYMFPEMIVTVLVSALLLKISAVRRMLSV